MLSTLVYTIISPYFLGKKCFSKSTSVFYYSLYSIIKHAYTYISSFQVQKTPTMKSWTPSTRYSYCWKLYSFTCTFLKLCFFYFPVKTCGKPHIQNIMSNVTARPGQMATFKCQVDMSCIVAYIEWYHEMDNGTEKLIKVNIILYIGSGQVLKRHLV